MSTLPARVVAALLAKAFFQAPAGGGGQPSIVGLPWEYRYLRSEYGLPDLVLDQSTTYDHAWWVDFDTGSDANSGDTENAPFKTFAAAYDAWATAGGPGRSVVWMAGSDAHKEYFSHDNAGFTSADGATECNTTPSGTPHALSASAPLHVRTKISDVKAGRLCTWDGSGIPKDYAGVRQNAHQPAQLCLELPHVVVRDMRFVDSAGNGVRFGILADARGSGRELQDSTARNVHVNHAHGDGIYSSRGNWQSWAIDCLVHHCQAWFASGGGNTSSGIKFPSNNSGGIVRSILFKNSDDNTDFLGANAMLLERNACWLAGWFWNDLAGAGETSASWTPHGEDFRVASSGNGNGFKMGGGGTSGGTIAFGNIAHNNKTAGFTDNSGEGYLAFNNSAIANDTTGYRMGGLAWLANNVAALNTNGAINDSLRSGATGVPYQTRNSWGDSAQAHRSGNFGLTLTEADFMSVVAGLANYARPASGGDLAGVLGFATPTECQSVTGWEGVSLPGINAQIGARS